jgi:hypothetical protein
MPIQYNILCTATIKAGQPAFSEIPATCVEDPVRGAETQIQRNYPIKLITVLVPTAPRIDFVVRVKKESIDGIIRPVADSVPASLINRLITVSGQLPAVFTRAGKPAIIYIAPMEKLSIFIVNLAPGESSGDTPVSFTIVAEKG